jgi:hypothetical protein
MSLDVYLSSPSIIKCPNCGHDVKYEDTHEVYWSNITHNLGEMAERAGIYTHLWHPEQLGITTAKELIEPLTVGLQSLKKDPKYYKKFDSSNGWGLYEHFVPWVEEYLNACIEFPNAEVRTSV